MEETNALQGPMEEEIDEPEISLDEKEEESDDQEEEEWIYPSLPSNESNSLPLTLFDCPPCLPKEDECHVPEDSFENVYNKALVFVDHEKHALLIVILLSLFMRLLKIIMREENMVVEVFMVMKHLSMC